MSKFSLNILHDRYDALLVANGTPPSRALFRLLRRRADRLIALDGGLEVFYRYQMSPDDVIGDFDSITSVWIQWAKSRGARIHSRPSVSEPDFSKGLEYCKRNGLKRVLVAGCFGDRADHIFSACHFAFKIHGLETHLITDSVVVFPLRGKRSLSLDVPVLHTISWFGMPEANECSLNGVRWPFRKRKLSIGGFHSLSNRPVEDQIQISQQAGHSMLVVSICPQTSQK